MRKSAIFLWSVISIVGFSTVTSAQTKINFSDTIPADGNISIGIYEGGGLGSFGQAIDRATNGGFSHAIEASGFEGKAQGTKLITGPVGSNYDQILLVGLGKRDGSTTALEWQKIGGNAVQKAISTFDENPVMVFDLAADTSANIAFGALYSAELDPVANAMWYTRDISNEPANVIYPQSFVDRWAVHLEGMANITIKVIDEKEMLELGMGAIYGVGHGSKRPPRMMIVEYMGGNEGDNPVLIAGKGITFDSGGISIKGSANMWNMKFDMSGAASTIGTIYALAGRGAKVNAVGIAALAENMPGGNAQRPGDVVKSMSGKTIQIRSTDAEGRLVLADGVYYGDVTYDPVLLVDMATLTGSARRALGSDYAALFSRHDDLADKLLSMGKKTGDELWQLPLNKNHFKAIENNVADVMNSGPTAPGASAGAAFIGTFVRETTNWAHLDIAGIAYSDKASPTKASPGSRAFGVRLLNGYIKEHYEGK